MSKKEIQKEIEKMEIRQKATKLLPENETVTNKHCPLYGYTTDVVVVVIAFST